MKVTDNFYVALPKGPISDEHFLIIPKKHFSSTTALDENLKAEIDEIKKDLT